MASKNYYIRLLVRVSLLTLFCFLAAYAWFSENGPLCVVMLFFVVLQAFLLVRFMNQTNVKIAYFFESLKNEDYTLRFPESKEPKTLSELHASMNRVNQLIRETQIKNKSQENYYQEILKQAEIGIMTVNDKGHVLFANPTVKSMFNSQQLNHLRQLERVDSELFKLLSDLEPIDRKLFQLTNERETVQLLIKSTEVVLNDKPLRLVIVQDINNELDQKETDSWMKLIRVLTHEIMNSVAPVTSISESILGYYKTSDGVISKDELNENHISNTVKGLEVIKSQGDDLMSFVQSYRSVRSVPEPDKKPIDVRKLQEKLEVLFSEEVSPDNVSLVVKPVDFELFADEKQITLVLINLLKNATQALTAQGGTIELSSGINEKNQKYIMVKDNGPGIPAEVLDQIFIPFFTTKDDGSGIGLSLSKQIMQIHGGGLSVRSVVGEATVFVAWFG